MDEEIELLTLENNDKINTNDKIDVLKIESSLKKNKISREYFIVILLVVIVIIILIVMMLKR